MRWLVVLGAVACGSDKTPTPTFDSAAFLYAFVVVPTGNTGPVLEPGIEIEYEFRADGECFGRRVDGVPFTPHKGGNRPLPGAGPTLVSVMLAPAEVIAVGMRVHAGSRELLRGCGRVALSASKVTPVEVELK